MQPNNLTALITGAGSGIGRALARILAANGYGIAALDHCEDGIRTLADELTAQQKRVGWRVADVTDPDALFQATRELEADLGPTDLLIASAGIGCETSGLDYSVANMNKVLNVNLLGVSNSIGAVLPGMIERKRGHLVGISSLASFRGLPRMLAYSASKAGVNAIMDGLRVELHSVGIHVTTVCPGWVKTPMTAQLEGDLEHLMEVEFAAAEIAYAIKKKLPFYAFPRAMNWRLRFIASLPQTWQDSVIRKIMHRVRIKK
jgi:short-subunit dehydrogenase